MKKTVVDSKTDRETSMHDALFHLVYVFKNQVREGITFSLTRNGPGSKYLVDSP